MNTGGGGAEGYSRPHIFYWGGGGFPPPPPVPTPMMFSMFRERWFIVTSKLRSFLPSK